MPSPMSSGRHRAGVIVVAALLLTAGCDPATDDGVAATVPGSEDGTARPTVTGPSTTAVDTTVSTLPPEPTGVPGLDDPDPFCAAWSRYSGTLQAISVAAAFGELSSVELARLEMIAAGSITESVAGIGTQWPSELVGERSAVLGDVLGPYERRAQRALQYLRDAGLTEDDIAGLRDAWLAALRNRDNEQPVIEVPGVPAGLAAAIDAAAASFDAAVTPFAQDPSLVTTAVTTPLTDAYLAERCPDLASVGVGDAI